MEKKPLENGPQLGHSNLAKQVQKGWLLLSRKNYYPLGLNLRPRILIRSILKYPPFNWVLLFPKKAARSWVWMQHTDWKLLLERLGYSRGMGPPGRALKAQGSRLLKTWQWKYHFRTPYYGR